MRADHDVTEGFFSALLRGRDRRDEVHLRHLPLYRAQDRVADRGEDVPRVVHEAALVQEPHVAFRELVVRIPAVLAQLVDGHDGVAVALHEPLQRTVGHRHESLGVDRAVGERDVSFLLRGRDRRGLVPVGGAELLDELPELDAVGLEVRDHGEQVVDTSLGLGPGDEVRHELVEGAPAHDHVQVFVEEGEHRQAELVLARACLDHGLAQGLDGSGLLEVEGIRRLHLNAHSVPPYGTRLLSTVDELGVLDREGGSDQGQRSVFI